MSQCPSALWLTVSPRLKRFDQRLLCRLSKRIPIARWEYLQTPDEPCCLETIIDLLHSYLQTHPSYPQTNVHLIGHGVSGIVGWLYTQRYPAHVRSLTLLSVNANPAVNWHAHYYALRQLLPCSREMILAQLVRMLFGPQSHDITRLLIQMLQQDLDTGFALHSLLGSQAIVSSAIEPPLLVCRGEYDAVVNGTDPWPNLLKPSDRIWSCPEGDHFFHFDQSRLVESVIWQHWQQVDRLTASRVIPSVLNAAS